MAANVHESGTGLTGIFGQLTGDANRLVVRTDERIAQVEPASTPNLSLLNATKQTRTIDSPELNVQEEWPINYIFEGTAVEPSTETTFAISDTTFLIPCMTARNLRTGEQIYIRTVASATSITVARAYGQTAAAATEAGDMFMVLHVATQEGQDRIQNLMRATGSHANYAQKFAFAFGLSDIMMKRAVYGPMEAVRLNTQAVAAMKKGMNRAYLFSEPYKDAASVAISGTLDTYVTGGGMYWAKLYNHVSLPGGVTYASLLRALTSIFRFGGSGERWGVGSTAVMQLISQLLPQSLQLQSSMSESTLGFEITRIKGAGVSALNLIADYTFDENYLNDMLLVEDLSYIEQGVFEPWTVEDNVQTTGSYRKEKQLFTRRMFIQRLPISSGLIDGLEYAA